MLVLGLLASGRASALVAGLCGLAAALLVAVMHTPTSPVRLLHEAGIGLWLSWLVVSIIVAGMFFHRCVQASAVGASNSPRPLTADRLWSVCFLLAPFAESVTGFGVGYIIALAALKRMGIGGLHALQLGLFSQSLVPWGALAIGTLVGAALADLTPNELGLRCALLQGPIHLLYLLIYWRMAGAAGVLISARQKFDDLVWTLALIGLLGLANAWTDVEIAAAAPTAALLALRYWRDERPDARGALDALRAHAPYVALTVALCATRLIAPLRATLKSLWAVSPYEGQPAFAPIYAPAFWLVCIGLLVLMRSAQPLLPVARQTLLGAWRAVAVTMAFLVMAQIYVGAGLAATLADALRQSAGQAAVGGVPVFSAVAGFLTGSGAASNAMLMPMVSALALALPADGAWLAAVQNTVCTNLSMLSPIRVSMGTAILGLSASEHLLYRRAWPLALPALIVGLIAAAIATAAG